MLLFGFLARQGRRGPASLMTGPGPLPSAAQSACECAPTVVNKELVILKGLSSIRERLTSCLIHP